MSYNTYVGPSKKFSAANPIDEGANLGKLPSAAASASGNNKHYQEDAILTEILDNINVQSQKKDSYENKSSFAEPTFQDNDDK